MHQMKIIVCEPEPTSFTWCLIKVAAHKCLVLSFRLQIPPKNDRKTETVTGPGHICLPFTVVMAEVTATHIG